MARFDSIKQTIDSNIKSNGNQEITGQKLNSVLNGMMSSVDAALTEVENAIPEVNEPSEGNGIVVDSALSNTSENPVQNKVVTAAIAELQDDVNNLQGGGSVVIDTTLNVESTNPVTNAAIKTKFNEVDKTTTLLINRITTAENDIKTLQDTGGGAGSASGSSARELYVDITGQGLTEEQKAYNAATFQMLKTTFVSMYVAFPGFPPYIITSGFGIAPSDDDTSFPLNMIVVTSSYSMVVPIVLMADGSTSDLQSALVSTSVFSTAGLLNFSDESSDKSSNVANYEAFRGIRNQNGYVNISIKISSTQYFATAVTPFVDYLEVLYTDYNNDIKKVHILPTGDIEDATNA